MTDSNIQSKNHRAARNLMVACGLLFFAFSFVYLYVLQQHVLEALHFYLSDGKTQYTPFWVAFILSVVLSLLQWGVNALLGLKGAVRTLSYFPSFLLLGVLTDVDYSVYQTGIHTYWMWLLPVLLLVFVLTAFVLRRVFRFWLDKPMDIGLSTCSNLTIFLVFCFMTTGIGNTNIHFHHALAVESAMRGHDYELVRKIGAKVVDPNRSLTALRAYAMSKEGTMGEYLFQYPQLYQAEGLLLDADDQNNLRMTVDSLYTYLGERPRKGERALPFFRRLCDEETGNHTTLEYYLSALLLDKHLSQFVEAFNELYIVRDSIPRHYKEALFLYEKQHPSDEPLVKDEAMEQRWQDYEAMKQEYAHEKHIGNRLRKKFSDTYWWYWAF